MLRQSRQSVMELAAMIGVGAIFVGASSNLAQAYQTVKVGPSGATVFAKPQSDSSTTGTLRAGQSVNIVEPPKNGFYRATGSGKVSGWVQEDSLVLPNHAHAAAPAAGSSKPADTNKAPAAEASAAPAGPTHFYIGAMAGLGIAGGGSSMAFGLDTGYKPTRDWGLGLYFNYMGLASATTVQNGTTGTTSSAAANIVVLALEANYFVPQAEGLHAGVKAGFAIASTSATAVVATTSSTTSSTTAFTGGVALGYDYLVYAPLSIGGEGNVMAVGGNISSTLIGVLGTLKYNF